VGRKWSARGNRHEVAFPSFTCAVAGRVFYTFNRPVSTKKKTRFTGETNRFTENSNLSARFGGGNRAGLDIGPDRYHREPAEIARFPPVPSTLVAGVYFFCFSFFFSLSIILIYFNFLYFILPLLCFGFIFNPFF
jgi:hypothetical protein